MYLAQVARRLIQPPKDIEAELELELGLAPLTLRGQLQDSVECIFRCKDAYAAAISKFELLHDYKELCAINDIIPSEPLEQYSNDLDVLYADAGEAHQKLRSLFACEWREWKQQDGVMLCVPKEGKAVPWVDRIIDPG